MGFVGKHESSYPSLHFSLLWNKLFNFLPLASPNPVPSSTHIFLWLFLRGFVCYPARPYLHPSGLCWPLIAPQTRTAKEGQSAAEPTPEPDADQYPEETQSDWDYNDTQSYPQHSWNDAETAEAEETWNHDQGYAAQTYTEPNWDDDDVGQGEWGDEEVNVEKGGQLEPESGLK